MPQSGRSASNNGIMTAARLRNAALLLPAFLAGCDNGPSTDPASRPAVVIVAAPQADRALSRPSRILDPPASPTFENRPPLTEMAPQKPFTDPPLPPELLDDGDLTPLPFPPHSR
jgi:hypothetical protein